VDSCDLDNEPSYSIKRGEFLDQLSVLALPSKGLCSLEVTPYPLLLCAFKIFKKEMWLHVVLNLSVMSF
jgi:hypothetical protein